MGLAIQDVINTVKGVFGWQDILNCQSVLARQLSSVLSTAKSTVESSIPKAERWLKQAKSQLKHFVDELDTALQRASGVLAGENAQPLRSAAIAAGPEDIQSGYLMRLTMNGMSSATLSADHRPKAAALIAACWEELPQSWQSAVSNADDPALQSKLESIQTTFISAAQASGLLGTNEAASAGIFGSPESLFKGSIGALIEVGRAMLALLKSWIDPVLGFIESGVRAILNVFARLYDARSRIVALLERHGARRLCIDTDLGLRLSPAPMGETDRSFDHAAPDWRLANRSSTCARRAARGAAGDARAYRCEPRAAANLCRFSAGSSGQSYPGRRSAATRLAALIRGRCLTRRARGVIFIS